MSDEPYSPPRAPSLATDVPAARPIAAWLLLVVLMLHGLSWTIGLVNWTSFVLSHSDDLVDPAEWAVSVLWRIGIVGLIVAVTVGIWCRRRWARWLGLVAIGVVLVFTQLGPDTTSYANEDQRVGGSIGRRFLVPLLMLSAWAFAFSAKAKRYFRAPVGEPR